MPIHERALGNVFGAVSDNSDNGFKHRSTPRRRNQSPSDRFFRPPMCYAPALSADAELAGATLGRMQRNWKAYTAIEKARFADRDAKLFLDDLDKGAPAKFVHVAYERDRYQPTSRLGRKFLRGCCDAVPHNEPVETCHLGLKLDAKKNANGKQRSGRMQEKVINSGILEGKGMQHYAAVTKDSFVDAFRDADASSKRRYHFPTKHKLDKSFSTLMGDKHWGTVNEDALRRKAAAWNWLEMRAGGTAQGAIGDALLSRLVMNMTVLVRGEAVFFSFGSYSWGALVGSAARVPGPGPEKYSIKLPCHAEFLVVTQPELWTVLPHQAVRLNGAGLVVARTGPTVGLLENCLRTKNNGLVRDDLYRLAVYLGIEGARRSASKEVLLVLVAGHVGGDELVEVVKASESTARPLDVHVGDPFFEAAFDELPEDDQMELRDVKDALKARRRRRRINDFHVQTGEVRRKRKRRDGSAGARRPVRRPRLRPPAGLAVAAAQPVADAPAPAVAPPVAPPVADGPAPPEPVAGVELRRVKAGMRAEPFAGGRFILADVHSGGVFVSWSCICNLHPGIGALTCNKTLTFGTTFTPEQAKRRIMKWCLDGMDIPSPVQPSDVPRHQHMKGAGLGIPDRCTTGN